MSGIDPAVFRHVTHNMGETLKISERSRTTHDHERDAEDTRMIVQNIFTSETPQIRECGRAKQV